MAQGNCRNSRILYQKHLSEDNTLCASPKIPNTPRIFDKHTKKYQEFNFIELKIEKKRKSNGTKTIWKFLF